MGMSKRMDSLLYMRWEYILHAIEPRSLRLNGLSQTSVCPSRRGSQHAQFGYSQAGSGFAQASLAMKIQIDLHVIYQA